MREVSGCDFCGGTASGTFEVLPAEYDPDGTGKRMLLCDHCRDALSSILDPLLDATAGTGRSPVAAGGTDRLAESARPPDDESAPTDGERGTDGARAASEDASGGTDDDGAGTVSGDDSGAAPDEETGAETRMAATGAGSSSRVPRGYRKVLRFLENREFPIDRREAVEMTADAYGLEAEAVDAAIDHAVTHGRLQAYDGELREA